MWATVILGLLSVLVWSTAQAQPVRKISTCFEQYVAALRLSQLEEAILHCDQIVEDKAAAPDRRGQALAQRGLMYARRWSILSAHPHALQGIADITEGLQLHTPTIARRHDLLIVRAQLYAAVGQLRRAAEDYRAILDRDPTNDAAQQGLRRLGEPHGS